LGAIFRLREARRNEIRFAADPFTAKGETLGLVGPELVASKQRIAEARAIYQRSHCETPAPLWESRNTVPERCQIEVG
jgi:hypothetical protein